jgi:hypothetical protein
MSDDPADSVAVLNVRSVVGIVVCFVVAAGALVAMPALRSQGLGFSEAFWLVSAVELVTALGIAYFVLNLHEERA